MYISDEIKETIIAGMANCKSEEEWNQNCDNVKKLKDGQYPDWWYTEIVLSGLAAKVRASWK